MGTIGLFIKICNIFEEAISSVNASSITTRGNESESVVRKRLWDLREFFRASEGATIAEDALAQLKAGVTFQEVIRDFSFPAGLRPECFKKAESSFKAYFLGKVVSDACSWFTHSDLVGGSLIATSASDQEKTFQLYDIVSSSSLPRGFLQPMSCGRTAWSVWAYWHFNAEREAQGLHGLPCGKIEHSACEYVRYIRQCVSREGNDCVPVATLNRIGGLGYLATKRAVKRPRES